MHLEYVGIRVTNLARSLKFCTDVLGLREVDRRDMTRYGIGVWVKLRDPKSGQQLELNWYPPESPYATPYVPGEGLDHIGFVVDDVQETFRNLLAKGAEPAGIGPEDTEGWTAFVRDPDGNWIEVYQLTQPRSLALSS